MPHRAQMWNSAVCGGSLMTTSRAPLGLEVHTPPCLIQNEQVQARTGISAGSGSQVREKEMFPQWHLPWINMRPVSVVAAQQRGWDSARPVQLVGTPFTSFSVTR